MRTEVFVGEQDVAPAIEQDGRDSAALHLVAVADGVVVGTTRVLTEDPEQGPLAGRTTQPVAHLGRLAVLTAWRGRGIGAALVRAAEVAVRDEGVAQLYLGAQTHALGFYAGLGYQPIGEQYLEAGIAHRAMHKELIGRLSA